MMLNILIVGASGYAGVELAQYLSCHPFVSKMVLAVSAGSMDVGKKISDLYPQLKGRLDMPLQPLNEEDIAQYGERYVVFLCTAHEVSHSLAPQFLQAGCVVFDLSGAFRVNDVHFYSKHYGFVHQYPGLLESAVYGLAEWQQQALCQARLIALPGCYPTASQLALKPLLAANLIDAAQWPVINAVSGVSGAGRKATLTTHFCEVSLQPYGVFSHRHQPEIVAHLGVPVVFTPHLGGFARGILATITCRLRNGVRSGDVFGAFRHAYHAKPLIRLYEREMPSLKAVIGLPYCDIGFAVQETHLIVVSAIDNLLKGAAAQAVQCMNMRFGFAQSQSLI